MSQLTISVILFLILCQSSPSAQAQQSSVGRTSTDIKSSVSRGYKSRWSFIVPSVVIHGVRPDVASSELMPRKLNKNGDAVVTPGAGVKYQGSEGGLGVIGLVKDCYDHPAGAFQWGRYFNISKDTHWGITGGLYIRQTPFYCEKYTIQGQPRESCIAMDDFDFKLVTKINGTSVDIIPMPFAHFSTSLYRDRNFEVHLKLMSNLVLNEFGIAIPF